LEELRLVDELGPGAEAPAPERLVQAFWTIQEMLEGVRETRWLCRRAEEDPAPAAGDGFDEAMELVDRLDSLEDGPREERTRIHAELRERIGRAMRLSRADEAAGGQLRRVDEMLRSLEDRLVQLERMVEPRGD